jgi:hypothetical protein
MKYALKESQHEKFEQGVFKQIRPVRVDDLGTRPKKFFIKNMVGALYFNFFGEFFLTM